MKLAGFINWFRPYIFDLSKKMRYLTDKLNSNANMKWTEEDKKKTQDLFQ